MLGLARMVRGTSIIALLCACDIHAHVHGRASCTRAWCGHGHAYGNDMRMRVAMLRACAWLLTAQVYYWQTCVLDSKKVFSSNQACVLIYKTKRRIGNQMFEYFSLPQ